jgi:hypothetical protein
MVDNQGTGIVRPYVLGGRVPGADGDPHDPGPVPVAEPYPSTTTVPAEAGAVSVTRNVGYTGRTGLTVSRGDSTVTVALDSRAVDALVWLLFADTPAPYQLANPPAGGDPR